MFSTNAISDLTNVITFICEWAFIKANSLKKDKERYMWLVGLEEEAQRSHPQEDNDELETDNLERFEAFLVSLITFTAVVRWVSDHEEELVAKDKSLKDNLRPVIDELTVLMVPITSVLANESNLLEGFGEFHYNYWYEHLGS